MTEIHTHVGSDAVFYQYVHSNSFKRTRCPRILVASLLPIRAAGSFEGAVSVQATYNVWENTTQKGLPLLVLLSLADHVNEKRNDGLAWPSQDRIAKRCRCGDRGVQKALKVLIKAKEIEVVRMGGAIKGNSYESAIYKLNEKYWRGERRSGHRGERKYKTGVNVVPPNQNRETESTGDLRICVASTCTELREEGFNLCKIHQDRIRNGEKLFDIM